MPSLLSKIKTIINNISVQHIPKKIKYFGFQSGFPLICKKKTIYYEKKVHMCIYIINKICNI